MKNSLKSIFSLFLGVFDDGRYWDIFAEYSKNSPNDVLAKITVENRGPKTARVHVLPTLWFRNTWSWGCDHVACSCLRDVKQEGSLRKPKLVQTKLTEVECQHDSLGKCIFTVNSDQQGQAPDLIFTENETNCEVEWSSMNMMSFKTSPATLVSFFRVLGKPVPSIGL